MATLITKGTTSLATANGFYRVEAANLGCYSATALALTTTRTIAVTFANAGNCQGLLLNLYTVSMTATRGVRVNLQENVAGTWTTRATRDMYAPEICGDTLIPVIGIYRGQFFTFFNFTTPYAVDTTASKWRFEISHIGASGTWNIRTSNGTAPFYATWCDNQLSWTDGDVLLVKDKCTIDRSAVFGAVVGTGSSVGVSCIIGSNATTPEPENVCLLEWQNPPTASYTVDFGGAVLMQYFSGIRVGTSALPIDYSKRAVIRFTAPSAGTVTPNFSVPTEAGTSTYGGAPSLFLYGSKPTVQYTELSATANSGQKTIYTKVATGWNIGDNIWIGKGITKGQSDTAIYQIANISGTEITLNNNLADQRIVDGTVCNYNNCGVFVVSTGTSASVSNLANPANFVIDGVDIYRASFLATLATYYSYLGYIKPALLSKYEIKNSCFWTNLDTDIYGVSFITPPKGALVDNNVSFRKSVANGIVSYYQSVFKSGRCEYKKNRNLYPYSGTPSLSTSIILTLEDNTWENGRTAFVYYTGKAGIFKNNKVWGNSNTTLACYYYGCINPIQISGNSYDNNTVAVGFATGISTLKCVEEDAKFGQEVVNTTDINILAGIQPDWTFVNPLGISVINESLLSEMVDDTRIGFQKFNGVDGADFSIFNYARMYRNTTVVRNLASKEIRHTAEGDKFVYNFLVPIGNIKNKTMMIGVWCKIANAAYWAGTHELPRLTIEYDGHTEAYAQCAQTTDWQFLAIPFTPATEVGMVSASISVLSDAVLADRYVYFTDYSVILPAGVQLNLGDVNNWYLGKPVEPYIATNLSPADVWLVQASTQTGTGTMGKMAVDVDKKTGLIPALL